MGALENVGQGIAQEAAVYLGGVHEALKIGEGAVGAAIAADEATRELLGDPSGARSSEAYTEVAESLFLIATRSTEIFRSLIERGLVDESRLPQLVASDALRLPSGDGDSVTEPTGETAVAQEQQQGSGSSAESTAADPELSETRERQEAILEDIFGEEKTAVIQSLTDDEMKQIGTLIEELYLRAPIGARGKSLQPERAQQFKEYISGTDPDEMATKYGITSNGIQANLRKAIEILHRDKSESDLSPILDGAVAQLRTGK